jgi:hypothetical protein
MKPALKEKKFVDILQYIISLLTLKYVFFIERICEKNKNYKKKLRMQSINI